MSITTMSARQLSKLNLTMHSQMLCNSKFPVELFISGEYLGVKVLIPMSEIKEYDPALLDSLVSLGLNIEESFMDTDLENAITSIYREKVFYAYNFFRNPSLTSVRGNTSVEIVDYEEDNPAFAFRFIVSSGDNSDLEDRGLDIFEHVTTEMAERMFAQLFSIFDTAYDRMELLEVAVRKMTAPDGSKLLDELFQSIIWNKK